MKKQIVITALFGLLLLVSCGEGGLDIVSPLDGEGEAPDILTGEVVLENMNDHAGVRIELMEIETSLLSNEDGSFILPENLAEGEWTITASYPFFSQTSQKFVIQNGMPSDELESMEMHQQIRFTVLTDKESYFVGETIEITLMVENLVSETITLASETSPQAALALRKDGATLMGSLLPGEGESPEGMTLDEGETRFIEASFPLSNAQLVPGVYDLYGVLADGTNYPLYFTSDEEPLDSLNETLFAKLTPTSLVIQ